MYGTALSDKAMADVCHSAPGMADPALGAATSAPGAADPAPGMVRGEP